eukprot:256351-Pelagomonas_calceolata.AAC.1
MELTRTLEVGGVAVAGAGCSLFPPRPPVPPWPPLLLNRYLAFNLGTLAPSWSLLPFSLEQLILHQANWE